MSRLRYALITPARNEGAFIEQTIQAVLSQTVPPSKWIIVSDGSTDDTDRIAQSYAANHDWIEVLRLSENRDRSFAAKAVCFNSGFELLAQEDFDLIGNLDADITFESHYYEFLIEEFTNAPDLGVAGTPFIEDTDNPKKHSYAGRFADLNHVSGACQIFRRECFVEVGGYLPIKGGGIDWVAVTTARMKGWQTKTFLEKTCVHHRAMGTASTNRITARFRHGKEDYYVGGHPMWQIFRGAFQMKEKPRIIGGLSLIAGYFWAMAKRTNRPISPELISFHRAEQMERLRKIVFR